MWLHPIGTAFLFLNCLSLSCILYGSQGVSNGISHVEVDYIYQESQFFLVCNGIIHVAVGYIFRVTV